LKFSPLQLAMAIAALSLTACGGGKSTSGSPPPPPSTANEWTWVNGANVVNQLGTYGTQGTPAPTNVPGAREQPATWADASGNFWIFGGNDVNGAFNDLWKYSGGAWTWVGGSNMFNQSGTYGTQGKSAPGNVPGARYSPVTWTDASGTFWLFGGCGYDGSGASLYLSDLWSYAESEWTWVGGPNMANQPGNFGTEGTSSPSNIPPPRCSAASWTDAAGDLWLFGGVSYLAFSGAPQRLNDLWKYSGGAWTWMSGSTATNQPGTYGTEGSAAIGSIPGGRVDAVDWTDAKGNLWLFGGYGYDSAGTLGTLNDLWNYNVTAGQWTWMAGSKVVGQQGTYGTQGIPAASNIPGSRGGAVGWVDAAGNFWLFGGLGYDSLGAYAQLNDLWKYSAGQWKWIGGSNVVAQQGIYGTQGTAAPGQSPGSRYFAGGWIDASGNFWLLGGHGYDSPGAFGYLNDLWKYQP
jgi:hypothetical protein